MELGTTSPIQVGTRGTVGSLIMREIEYFNRVEFRNNIGNEKLPCHQVVAAANSSGIRSSIMAAKRKKKSGSKLIPRLCSMVDVADSKNYMNLKTDVKKLPA